jgi:Cft2 family RNA processing exonuclease
MLFTNLTRRTEIGANCYLLELGGKRVILDSGLHPRQEGMEAMPRLDLLGPDSVDAIFLSHSHQDHLGSLPILMRYQSRAQVFMTEATRQLSDVMLHNSVNVMTRIREERGLTDYPLFTHREADQSTRRWRACPLRQPITLEGERASGPPVDDEVTFEFFEAGHVLGAVGVLLRAGGRTVLRTETIGERKLKKA